MKPIELDAIDLKLLDLLQRDASMSNLALAEAAHTSPPTCLRRIKQLQEAGLIERHIAILNPQTLSSVTGHGLQAIVEITLDHQHAEAMDAFEKRAVTDDAVQQCYRVSPGPDFILVIFAADMPSYLELAQRLFTQDANVRNVKTFFSVKRSKFGAYVTLPKAGN